MAVTARSPKTVSESIAEAYTGGRGRCWSSGASCWPTSRSFQDERCTNAAPEPVLYGRLFVAEYQVRVSRTGTGQRQGKRRRRQRSHELLPRRPQCRGTRYEQDACEGHSQTSSVGCAPSERYAGPRSFSNAGTLPQSGLAPSSKLRRIGCRCSRCSSPSDGLSADRSADVRIQDGLAPPFRFKALIRRDLFLA